MCGPSVRTCAAFLSFALVASLQAFVPIQAEAATGLFSVKRTLYSDQVGKANQTRTATFPAATGYVGSTAPPRFSVPKSVIKSTTGYAACVPGTCRIVYPESKAWYSYWNLRGSFRPNNPYGATMTTTVRFPTITMMGIPGPPHGTGEPVTPTTTFDGRYDFARNGSIMVTPGSNRFGGTMQFFYGPNHRYYQRNTSWSDYTATSLGGGPPALSTYHESQFGEFVVGRTLNGYRLTYSGFSRLIVATTSSYTCTNITSANCEYYQTKIQHLSTIVPFTTGMISGYQPGGPGATTTVHTITGYDNRTAAGLNGVVSLVRARLVHPYRVTWSGFIGKFSSTLSASKIDFHFLPEPGSFAMMAAGVVALAGLYRRRRHCVER